MAPADTQRLQAALAEYNAGNLRAAEPVLKDLAGRYPRHAETQAAAGMTLAELGSIAEALTYLQRAHTLAPHDTAVALNLAVAQMKTGHSKDALAVLQAAARQQPEEGSVYAALAQAQFDTGDAEAATVSFARADALLRAQGEPIDAGLHYDWAVALLRAGKAPLATSTLLSVPNANASAAIQELLGEAEEKNSHFQEALQHFKRAAELEGSEPNLYAYGNELLQHWTFSPAIEIFKFAISRFPASERLHMALGIAYYGNGTYDEAANVFQALLSTQPDNATAADLLGRSCSALSGEPRPGCASLQQFALAHPENAPASLFAAIMILHQPTEQQDTAEAGTLLQNALKKDPKLADAWYQLGALQQSQNQWDESTQSLQRAIAVRPGYPEAHYRLARAYSHLGKREEAKQEILLQQKFAAEAKTTENERMHEVMKFLTTSN